MAPGAIKSTWLPEHTVKQRLFRAQLLVKTLTKDVEVKASRNEKTGKSYGGFSGISAAQVVDRAKEALLTCGIVYTSQVSRESIKTNGNTTELWVDGRFESFDNADDFFVKGAPGRGNDNSDNGFKKATTDAEKGILGRVLMMTTFEDEGEPVETKTASSAEPLRQAQAQTEAAIRSWADAFKRALDGCSDLRELKRIRAENAHMMNSEAVPQVTKDYFIDRIGELEGLLS